MSPQRVPIIRPARGVIPMEVSMHFPSFTALIEEPFPIWQVTIFVFSVHPKILHISPATNR